jgi:hypothetical protein
MYVTEVVNANAAHIIPFNTFFMDQPATLSAALFETWLRKSIDAFALSP